MRVLNICLIMLLCIVIKVIDSKNLRAPSYLSIAIYDEGDPKYFNVAWNKVDNVDDDDPVIGYKVKVLEFKKTERKITKVFNNNTGEVVETEEYPKLNENKEPEGNATEMIIPASDSPNATFLGLQLGVPYQVTVLAFTKKQEGPASVPDRFRVHEPK